MKLRPSIWQSAFSIGWLRRRRDRDQSLFIEIRFARRKRITAKLFLSVEGFENFIRGASGDGHAPWAISAKWRVQEAVAPRQVNEITASLIQCPGQPLRVGHRPDIAPPPKAVPLLIASIGLLWKAWRRHPARIGEAGMTWVFAGFFMVYLFVLARPIIPAPWPCQADVQSGSRLKGPRPQ